MSDDFSSFTLHDDTKILFAINESVKLIDLMQPFKAVRIEFGVSILTTEGTLTRINISSGLQTYYKERDAFLKKFYSKLTLTPFQVQFGSECFDYDLQYENCTQYSPQIPKLTQKAQKFTEQNQQNCPDTSSSKQQLEKQQNVTAQLQSEVHFKVTQLNNCTQLLSQAQTILQQKQKDAERCSKLVNELGQKNIKRQPVDNGLKRVARLAAALFITGSVVLVGVVVWRLRVESQ